MNPFLNLNITYDIDTREVVIYTNLGGVSTTRNFRPVDADIVNNAWAEILNHLSTFHKFDLAPATNGKTPESILTRHVIGKAYINYFENLFSEMEYTCSLDLVFDPEDEEYTLSNFTIFMFNPDGEINYNESIIDTMRPREVLAKLFNVPNWEVNYDQFKWNIEMELVSQMLKAPTVERLPKVSNINKDNAPEIIFEEGDGGDIRKVTINGQTGWFIESGNKMIATILGAVFIFPIIIAVFVSTFMSMLFR